MSRYFMNNRSSNDSLLILQSTLHFYLLELLLLSVRPQVLLCFLLHFHHYFLLLRAALSERLFQYQLYLLLNSFFCYSWGISQLMPADHRGGWKDQIMKLCNPVLLSIFLGSVLGLTGLASWVPGAIHTTLENLGNCFSIVSLILTGHVIGNYRILTLIREKRTYWMAALRLILIPGAFLVVLRALHLPDMLCLWTCLVYACPCGMNTVVFPAAYGQDTRPGASLTLVTSTLAVITIPILMSVMV